MRLLRPLFYSFVLLLFALPSFAQKQKMSGKIVNNTGLPLEGVSVQVKGTNSGTLSGKDGVFTIDAAPDDVLIVSFVGYGDKSVKVKDLADMVITIQPNVGELMEVVVIGSRGAARVKTESPVPVDVININQVSQTTGRPELMSQLNISVPSFNYNKQSGGDGADAIDFASLRGLGFDQTLVLVNGKRRHMSAFVNQAGTRGRGNSGYDLNSIPEAAIDRVEILRDGASAQYGSDAIAGVINIVLKKDVNHLNVVAGASSYYDPKYNTLNSVDPSQFYTGSWLDGKTVQLGLDYGIPVGKRNGYINFAGNFLNHGKTFRALPDTSTTSGSKDAIPVNSWRRAFGDGAVLAGGGMVNSEIPISDNTTFYFYGGYNYKRSQVYAWTRNYPSAAARYPTELNGDVIFVPEIMRTASDGTIFFNPQENVKINDASFAVGLKGTFKGNFLPGFEWDFSNVTGRNDFHYFGHKTFNASLPQDIQATKNDFDDGGFNFLQNTANLDLTKLYKSVAQGLTLSFGGEFRYERYQLYAGEPDSYRYGGAYFVKDGDTTIKRSGSQGYPGYQPGDEVIADRTNIGGYVDVAIDVTKKWLVDAAARFENYSDFGFVNTYKLATRYKLGNDFNIRGSVSTGFRAPSLQQINFSNTNTTIVNLPGLGPTLQYTKLSPNYSEITRAAGVPQLKQEESVNASLGFTAKPFTNFTITLDGYWVKVKNRVVITGNFDESTPAIAPYLEQYNVSAVNFFSNAVSTTNRGLDIVADYAKNWGKRKLKVTLAGNLQDIKIDNINIPDALNDSYAHQQAFFSSREQAFLIASAPKMKFSLSGDYSVNNVAVGARLNYFGKLMTKGFGYASLPGAAPGGPGGEGISDQGQGWDPYVTTDDGSAVIPENFVFNGKFTTDIYGSLKLSSNIRWYAGVDNIFNVHPDVSVIANAKSSSWGDSESGGPFDAVQMGFNGIRLFTKFVFNF